MDRNEIIINNHKLFDDLRMAKKKLVDALNETYRGELTIRRVATDEDDKGFLERNEAVYNNLKEYNARIALAIFQETIDFLDFIEEVLDEEIADEQYDFIKAEVEDTIKTVDIYIASIRNISAQWQQYLLDFKEEMGVSNDEGEDISIEDIMEIIRNIKNRRKDD